MFWIQNRNWYEKNVDNTLMFSVVARNQGLFKFPCLARVQCAGAPEAGTEQSQSNKLQLANGIFHIIQHHAQYIDEGKLGASRTAISGFFCAPGSLVRNRLGIYYSFAYLIVITAIIIIILFPSLYCFYLNLQVSLPLPLS